MVGGSLQSDARCEPELIYTEKPALRTSERAREQMRQMRIRSRDEIVSDGVGVDRDVHEDKGHQTRNDH